MSDPSIFTPELILRGLTIAVSLVAIIFSFGVVWRTEEELDISYKLLLAAIIAFTVSQSLELFVLDGRAVLGLITLAAKLLFAIFFLAGIFTARDLLRRMDGEKGMARSEEERIGR